MGDAILRGHEFWSKFDYVYIIWGDQVNVSQNTMNLMTTYAQKKRPVIPLTRQPDPYVEYEFDDNNSLYNIKQSREGDQCKQGGLSDIGLFGLPVESLKTYWDEYLQNPEMGNQTNEVNFLPFSDFSRKKQISSF